jgi:2-oxoglutarate dehydrogenase complex dehydrogenase (E1) component-like enzyme
LKDTCTQLEHYCKHTIAEFKEKFLHVLRNAMEEKKESEKKLVFLASKVSRDTEAKDREDELLKAAMYHVSRFNTMDVH